MNRVKEQLAMFTPCKKTHQVKSYVDKLNLLLRGDLDFHNHKTAYATHNFHSFPAKFPPQLPNLFISELTKLNEIVLDPMLGSGTTIVESFLANRTGIGFDIDPLAILIANTKVANINKHQLILEFQQIIKRASKDLQQSRNELALFRKNSFDPKTKEFIDYWFVFEIQLELMALIRNINLISKDENNTLFKVIFSSIIITKSGGVSLALDLGHTRPHKAKILFDRDGNQIYNYSKKPTGKEFSVKTLKSPIEEFSKKFHQIFNNLAEWNSDRSRPIIQVGDSQHLDLANDSIDLIITSPPYASNAIDYMRAHKFSLVWFGYSIQDLSRKRTEYIGSENISNYSFESLPFFTRNKVNQISNVDAKKAAVLNRYYSEMTKSLREMFRVLKPQKAAIVVVGSSIMRGIDIEIHECLKEIGEKIGFIVPHVGIRRLDRNKRMLPAGLITDSESQIQQRMHQEYVIGFYKP
jgi:DNA modification methylase